MSLPAKGSAKTAMREGVFRSRRLVLRFVLLFAVFMGLFELACATSLVADGIFPAYLRFNARISGAIIGLFEESLEVTGRMVSSNRYRLVIERGCDAIEPSALFVSGVLAFPLAALRRRSENVRSRTTVWQKTRTAFTLKLPGILIGTVCLMLLNLVRVVSLFYVGVYWQSAFDVIHVDVWQSLFIVLAILFWVLWAVWATRTGGSECDAIPG